MHASALTLLAESEESKKVREGERKRKRERGISQSVFLFLHTWSNRKLNGILSLVPFTDKCFYVQDRLFSHLLFEVLDSGLKILQF